MIYEDWNPDDPDRGEFKPLFCQGAAHGPLYISVPAGEKVVMKCELCGKSVTIHGDRLFDLDRMTKALVSETFDVPTGSSRENIRKLFLDKS